MSEAPRWSTIVVTHATPATTQPELVAASEQLEGLAALLAERDDVGGVETRDPFTIAEGPDFEAVDQPKLVIYTTPEGRAGVEQAASGLAEALGLRVALEAEDHAGDAWRDAWKRHYRSLRFTSPGGGRSLMLRPSWIPREPDDPACELVLDPGRAFGTGLHESTRLCLDLLVGLAESGELPERGALDLGCGSGILGLALLRLAPSLERVVLGDHDPEAVATTLENAASNELEARVEARSIRLAPDPAETAGLDPHEAHALVLANIRPEILIPAAQVIAGAVAAGGRLLLSGILDEEADDVRAAYPDLELVARPSEGGWTALLLRKAP